MILLLLLFLFAAGFVGVVFLEAAALPKLKLLVSKDGKPDPSLPREGNQESPKNGL